MKRAATVACLFALAACGDNADGDGAVTGVPLRPATLSLTEGSSQLLSASVLPESAKNKKVTWDSSNPAVVSVEADGLECTITAVSPGQATVVVVTDEGKFRASYNFSVTNVAISLDKPALILPEGTTETLVAIVDSSVDRVVTWVTNDHNIATVDENGTVTAVSKGSAEIMAITDGGNTAVCEVTVTRSVAGVSLETPTLRLMVTNTFPLKALIVPFDANNHNVSWSSATPSVATIDDNGVVTALALGETVITATTEDGNLEAECVVTVREPNEFLGTVSFRSNKQWVVGNQTWSDVVMSSGCKKDEFNSETYSKPECRQSVGYGDLYSWRAVNQYKADLCPNGWRVPTSAEFVALHMALGGNGQPGTSAALVEKFVSEWGMEYGGSASHVNTIVNVGTMGRYWSGDDTDAIFSPGIELSNKGYINPIAGLQKAHGQSLRCVK